MSKTKANNEIKSKVSQAFWRIFISLIGISLILITISNLLLFFFGETAYASVTTRRVGGSDDNRTVNQRYVWSIDYTFKDKEGVTHNGHTTRRGGDMSVNIDNKVYYFPFAPITSALESEAQPNVFQLILVAIGAFIIYVMNSEKNKPKKTVKKQRKNNIA